MHLVPGNRATRKTPAVRAWLLKHPRFHLHFTLASSSWMNVVQRWSAGLAARKLRGLAHRRVTGLKAGIRRWINEWVRDLEPFSSITSADGILATLVACCQRLTALSGAAT